MRGVQCLRFLPVIHVRDTLFPMRSFPCGQCCFLSPVSGILSTMRVQKESQNCIFSRDHTDAG
jgi:hypothetical protein